MNPNVRAAIAYIVGRSITKKNASAVYDYDSSGYWSMAGEVSATRVNIYDYKSGCYVAGNFSSLYHYGTGNYIQLTIRGNHFNGYDYHTSSYYQGNVSGSMVTVYDYEDGRYHNYSV